MRESGYNCFLFAARELMFFDKSSVIVRRRRENEGEMEMKKTRKRLRSSLDVFLRKSKEKRNENKKKTPLLSVRFFPPLLECRCH